MNSFRRGLRNRNPLVLIVALALLVPALLGIQSWFTSSAWSAVPVQSWVRNSTDDYMVVSWIVGRLRQHPPEVPLAVLLGGSSGREAIVSGPSLARQVEASGGPEIDAYNLSSRMQRYAQSWAIVDNLPDTPTTVLVGVNLGRFTTSPESNYNQVIGRELLLKSDSLRRWVNEPLRRAQVLLHHPAGHLLGAHLVPAAARERPPSQAPSAHQARTSRTRSTSGTPCPTRRSRASSRSGWTATIRRSARCTSSTRPCSTG